MSLDGQQSASIILPCPKCGKKNRVPMSAQNSGRYTCGACHETIFEGKATNGASQTLSPSIAARIGKLPILIRIGYLCWAVLLLVVTLSNLIGPEYWLPGSVNLYLPQIIWALPALILVPWTLIAAPKWLILSAILLAYVFGPIMGLVWNPSSPSLPNGGVKIRVMQCNVKWAREGKDALAEEVESQHPDVIQFQDSGGRLDWLGPISQDLAGWNIRSSGQYITASRLPMSNVQSVDISYPGQDDHHSTRILITVGKQQVALYNVHLLSPRWGLVSFRHHDSAALDSNVEERLDEVIKLAAYLRADRMPILLTGDINSPMQGIVCRNIMGDKLHDAFQDSGNGYGYSYGQDFTERLFRKFGIEGMREPYVRIDHILYSSQWTAVRCWTGSPDISEHVPVYADMYLNGAANGGN